MEKLFEIIRGQLLQKKDVVLVTVLKNFGSTPREAGARMAVGKDGLLCGTVGGGAVEYRCMQIASGTLESGKSEIRNFSLTPAGEENVGMLCGGRVTVCFRYISCADRAFLSLIDRLLQLCGRNETSWLLTDLSAGAQGEMGMYGVQSGLYGLDIPERELKAALTGRTQSLELNGRVYCAEELVGRGRVYLFGGGHVAQELAPLLSHLGFRCVVADDRPEFTAPGLFPGTEEILLVDFKDFGKKIALKEDDAVCVMTYASDIDVLTQALRTPVHYVGMVGSRQKRTAVAKILGEHGIGRERIAGVHTPIGLEIKAETPAEIAVSVAAELILDRAEREKRPGK